MNRERAEVVVVGGGVIGCVAAKYLAPSHDLVLLERDQIAGETTGKASGLITNPASFREYPEFARYATDFFREYDGTGQFSFTERRSVELISESAAAGRETAAASSRHGFATEFLPVDELTEEFPDVFALDDYAGGVVFEDTGWVDPYTYAMTLKDDAADDGVDIETGVTVERVTTGPDGVTGVETDAGRIEAEQVICAAGWRTRPLLADHVDLPIRPLRWQSATLDPGWEPDSTYPMGWDETMGCYWRPEHNGDVHFGGGEYVVEDPGSLRQGVNEEFKLHLSTAVPARLQGFRNARFVEGHACPTGDATTPDMYPIIDAPADGPDGLVVATGFHVGGIMSSPAVGAAIRSLITDEAAPFSLDSFALDRFENRSPEFAAISHMTHEPLT